MGSQKWDHYEWNNQEWDHQFSLDVGIYLETAQEHLCLERKDSIHLYVRMVPLMFSKWNKNFENIENIMNKKNAQNNTGQYVCYFLCYMLRHLYATFCVVCCVS